MMICTLASNPEQERKRKKRTGKKKSLLYNSDIYWSWSRLTLSVPPVQAKQSKAVCEAEEMAFVVAKRLKFELKKERKMSATSWNLSWTVPGFPSSRRFFVFFLHKQDGKAVWRKFSDMLQPVCDTNILQYVLRCLYFFLSVFFSFRYWTPVRRPALTHRLITWFIHIYKNL